MNIDHQCATAIGIVSNLQVFISLMETNLNMASEKYHFVFLLNSLGKKGNSKRKKRAVKRSNTSLKDLSKVLEDHWSTLYCFFFKSPTYFSITYFRY